MAKSPSANIDLKKTEGTSWLTLGLVWFVGLLMGSTGTYLQLRPKLQTFAVEPAPTPALDADPLSHLPSPDPTAGLAPAQADRTLGNFFYDHQNWVQAIRYYESAIKQGADDADIRTDLGNAYRFTGRPDDALMQYRLAQQMDPSHEFSLFNQGGVYLEDLRQPQKAVEVWNDYLRRFPQGRNAGAARELIAQVGRNETGPLLTVPSSGTAPKPATSNADVDRLLKLVPPAPPAAGKP